MKWKEIILLVAWEMAICKNEKVDARQLNVYDRFM